MELAPIGVCTYSRLNHLIKTVDALKANTLAQQSEIYIFSDGPRPGDEAKVQELRDYLKTITGFKKVHLRLQPTNNMFENTSNAHVQMTAAHGKSIALEDDIVTSPYFLEFMNTALERYESNKKIFSIGAYSPAITFPKSDGYDVFFSQIFCPWGVGMWKDRFDISNSVIASWSTTPDKRILSKLKHIGKNLARRYKSLCKPGISHVEVAAKFDLAATVAMLKNQLYTVMPRRTLVENIGLDGSGIHCTTDDAKLGLKCDPSYRPTKFNDKPFLDPRIGREVYLQGSFSKVKNPLMRSFYLLIRAINHRLSFL